MKLISWNVNGLRAVLGKGFYDAFAALGADVVCLQETKCSPDQVELELPGYHQYFNSAEKKGYSGTAVFTKEEPLSVSYGMGMEEHDHEGRIITAEYQGFYLVNVYTPNAKRDLSRLAYRCQWEDDFAAYLKGLDTIKPVITCGDMNVAHQEIDLKNPKPNRGNAGFTDEEREKMTRLLEKGFVDSFRHLYPDMTGAYSWWSYMYHAREKNAGWRIDYFLVSERYAEAIADASIHSEIMGSDHCPIELLLK